MAAPNEDEKRKRVIELVFADCPELFDDFCDTLRRGIPEATAAVLRGSAVTGFRWKDGAPFDADGPGTSDLDVTLLGDEVLQYFDGFWLPGLHSKPVNDDEPEVAPRLLPLREKLVAMVGRPVNLQGTRDWFQHFRGDLLGQPYLTLFGKVPDSEP